MKRSLIPGILEQTVDAVNRKREIAGQSCEWIQLDVLDDTLYPNRTCNPFSEALAWPPHPRIELHVMTNDPESILNAWRHVPAFGRIVWHIEAPIDHAAMIRHAHHTDKEAGLAIAPGSSVGAISSFLMNVDRILVLGVRPGKSGQTILPETLDTVREVRTLAPTIPISFDGGVTVENIPELLQAGVTDICATSTIFAAPDPVERIRELQALLKE